MRLSCFFLYLLMLTLSLPAVARQDPGSGADPSGILPSNHRRAGVADEAIRAELDFVLYLMGRGDFRESLFLLEGLGPGSASLEDSLHYLTGWVLYHQKMLEPSASRLMQVSYESPVYHKSHFFAAYNLAHAGNTRQARSVLQSVEVAGSGLPLAMLGFQLGGIDLLERNLDAYAAAAPGRVSGHHALAHHEGRMQQHYTRLRSSSQPVPMVAAGLSAIVPGLGKIYAGKPAEGIAAFLYTTALGLAAYDAYRGGGTGNPLFLVTATVTAVFYGGNILGSATAARRTQNEFKHEMDQRILFDMHIPLRNAYP